MRFIKDLILSVYDLCFYLVYSMNPKGGTSIGRIKKLRDKYKGKTCFILGNGPSLNKTNLGLLKNKYTFGLNKIYLLFGKTEFRPTFYVAINKFVIEQSKAEINRFKIPKFISFFSEELVNFDSNTMFLNDLKKQQFSKNIDYGIYQGSTVTFVALQIAYYLGFKKVFLIGVDHSFSTKGPAHKVVTSRGKDPNHFDSNYFGKGTQWQLPDLKASENSYRLAKMAFEDNGREIIDATIDGKLKVFKKVRYNDIFK